MAYSKKSLLIFSTVALSTAAVASFFIRQKILNNWKISEFNALLEQIADLETEIQKNKKNLKDSEKLRISTEEKNRNIDQKIHELEESVKNYGKQITELESKHASWERDINFANFLEIYKKLGSSIYYWRTIAHHISNKNNMLEKIYKHKETIQKEAEQKENLKTKKTENENLLSKLREKINLLTKNLSNQQSKLISLKNQERERERAVN